MRSPRLIVRETDGMLAGMLADAVRKHSWLLREIREPEACLNLLRRVGPSVLFVRLDRKLLDELTFLGQAARTAPDCPIVLIFDVKMDSTWQRTQLAGLFRDLGASAVLFPPVVKNLIEEVAETLLPAVVRRFREACGD